MLLQSVVLVLNLLRNWFAQTWYRDQDNLLVGPLLTSIVLLGHSAGLNIRFFLCVWDIAAFVGWYL